MPSYKLMYFDTRGRAEAIRLLFKIGDIPFEDKRLSWEEWPAVKQGDTCPYKVMPILIVDDKTTLCNTSGLVRYVAAITGLEPEDKLHRGIVDSVSYSVLELASELAVIKFTDRENKVAEEKKHREVTFPFNCKVWENYLEQCRQYGTSGDDNKFFGGNKICYADVEFFVYINSLFMSGANSSEVPEELESFPSLCAVYRGVYENHRVKEHCSTRPTGPM